MFSIHRFGEFRLDPASRELWRGDQELALPPKAFGCLVYLIEHRNRAVGRDELIDAVWGKENLTDSVLGRAIFEVRRALDDDGDEPQFIKTVRGFGYRWVAPVETVEAPTEADTARVRSPARARLLLGVVVAGVLTAGASYLWQRTRSDAADPAVSLAEGDLALLLPVTVEEQDRHPWIRLGVMDLLATRLRAAGQPMVPSDTVIALLRDHAEDPDREEIEGLRAATGARLVLGARAEATGERWRVSLQSLLSSHPALTIDAEADDVLEAARIAADRLALSLGLMPASEPTAEPRLALLLQRTEAAMLAQQMDSARTLIAEAGTALRRHPEVRLQQARIELHDRHLDAAEAAFEALLAEAPGAGDSVLRARALHGLGAVHYRRHDLTTAEPFLEEAARLLDRKDMLGVRGRLRNTLGVMALERYDLDAARVHLAHARGALEGAGDALGLADLENNLGVLEGRRERHAEALSYFERAAERYRALHGLGEELGARANIIHAHLHLLDPQAALAVEPRLDELLAQTTNPQILAFAHLAKAQLLAANGRARAAESLLSEVLRTTETSDDLPLQRMAGLVLRAEWAEREGDSGQAARLAAEVVERLPPGYAPLEDERGRAWRILVQARLAQEDRTAAAVALAAMIDWAQRSKAPSAGIHAALAQAELAAADGGVEAAAAAFEHALALASAGHAPLRLLQVAQAYVPWLLRGGPRRAADAERAMVVASRVAAHADRDYDAALLQLHVYHATGNPAAWRTALRRTRSLAGERAISPELLEPPPAP